jgi:hypothetical protein
MVFYSGNRINIEIRRTKHLPARSDRFVNGAHAANSVPLAATAELPQDLERLLLYMRWNSTFHSGQMNLNTSSRDLGHDARLQRPESVVPIQIVVVVSSAFI